MQITYEDAVAKYGAIEDGKWPKESEFCELYSPPSELAWINSATGKPVTHIYCNRDLTPFLDRALKKVMAQGLAHHLKTFDGCLMIRDVRGEPGKLSAHAYALAIDINAGTNPLGKDGDMDLDLVNCFTGEGFSWGGDFPRKDPMHFSRAWE